MSCSLHTCLTFRVNYHHLLCVSFPFPVHFHFLTRYYTNWTRLIVTLLLPLTALLFLNCRIFGGIRSNSSWLCLINQQTTRFMSEIFIYASSSTLHPVGRWAKFRTSVASRLACLFFSYGGSSTLHPGQ